MAPQMLRALVDALHGSRQLPSLHRLGRRVPFIRTWRGGDALQLYRILLELAEQFVGDVAHLIVEAHTRTDRPKTARPRLILNSVPRMPSITDMTGICSPLVPAPMAYSTSISPTLARFLILPGVTSG